MGACCTKDARFSVQVRYGHADDHDHYNGSDKECNVAEEEDESILEEGGALVRLQGSSTYVSMFSQQGRKGINQDCITVWEEFNGQKDMFFCGVFDGHGPLGHRVARFVRDKLPTKLSTAIKTSILNTSSDVNAPNGIINNDPNDSSEDDADNLDNASGCSMTLPSWEAVFVKSFKEIDEQLSLNSSIDSFCSGTTAVTLIKQGNQLVIANLGDSRAILCTQGDGNQLHAAQLTVDLKPDVPSEAERVRNCNGRIFALDEEPQVFRIWMPDEDCPGLAMARAFGDFCIKDYGLIAVPEVIFRKLSDKDEFLVLATDGIWDVLTNEEVIRVVATAKKRTAAAQLLVNHATRAWRIKYPSSRMDDCSVICLFLKDQPLVSKCMSSSSEVGPSPNFFVPRRSRSVRSECGLAYLDASSKQRWSIPEGTSKANSLLKLSQVTSAVSRRKPVKEWQADEGH